MSRSRYLLSIAMMFPDDLVVLFRYRDRHGKVTRRVVSPVRFVGRNCFVGLCLVRADYRQFRVDECRYMKVGFACDFMMPLER